MKAQERRTAIANLLLSENRAVSGGELSEVFGVSRQIIVQDITVLRSAGYDILSTHSGYVMQDSPLKERVFKVYHTTLQTEDELNLIVDLGGTVVNIFVWHKVYGRVMANLNIFSRLHVKQFIEGVRTGKSTELMNITGGYHYHTVRAESEAVLDKIEKALAERGYIVPEI
ncbi:MAG: transcription repressor NadR [Ruminococcaceae bacterium]|nr:transcription repressor NadR [Oscillospiraceae bacterium]